MVKQNSSSGVPASPELEVTPAAEWTRPFVEPKTDRLPSGRVCRYRILNPTGELLAGTLPNPILACVVFGEPWDPAPDDPPAKVAKHYEGLVAMAARILVEPRLVVRAEDEPPADPAKGEISPESLTPDDLYWLRNNGLYLFLPTVQDAPFRDSEPHSSGVQPASLSSSDLPHPASSLSGSESSE